VGAEERPPNRLKELVTSDGFHSVGGVVIIANVCFMVVQADHPGNHGRPVSFSCEVFFLSFFSLELFLRILADRSLFKFLTDPQAMYGNIFDFLLVTLNFTDTVAAHIVGHGHRSQALAQCMRSLRVLRVLRLVRHFHELRFLMWGLVDSVKYVSWIIVLAVAFMFIFAIMCTMNIGQNAYLWGDDKDEILKYFGSVETSMFTLLQTLTLDDWNGMVTLVDEEMPGMTFVLFIYIVLMSFVVVSLFSGSMVNHMIQVAAASKSKEEEDLADAAQKMFPSGYLRRGDFLNLFASLDLRTDLQINDIEFPGGDALVLFEYFDRDHDGVINISEFVSSCMDYRRGLTVKSALACKRSFMVLFEYLQTNGLDALAGARGSGAVAQPLLEEMDAADRRLRAVELEMIGCEQQMAQMQELVDQVFGHRTVDEMVYEAVEHFHEEM